MTARCWCAGSWTASGTPTSQFTSGCHVMFWRTGCFACGRTCGGRRRRWEPEASPEATRQERSGCPPSTAEVAGKTAVEVATRTAKAGPGQVGGVTAVGLGEAKDTGCGERGAGGRDRDTVLFLSYPEEQKLRFQGADHFAALRGPSSPGRKFSLGFPAASTRALRNCATPVGRVPLSSMDCCDGFIGTFSGLRFWPLDPNPEKILIADIAHALAHQCRFGGHASKFYSVAEHSVHVSRLCWDGPPARESS